MKTSSSQNKLEPAMRHSNGVESSWRQIEPGAREHTDATIHSSNSPTHRDTPNKEQFTQRQQSLSDIFDCEKIQLIDATSPYREITREFDRRGRAIYRGIGTMTKKRRSRILDDDEFREAYGFVRHNSMNNRTRILTRQTKIESLEYPSDSTSYTSGDLLAEQSDPTISGSAREVATRPFDTWSHRSSSGLGSESEEIITVDHNQDHHCIDQSGYVYHKIARRTFSPVWALCSDNVLYLYESAQSETTLDVICLQSYRSKPAGSQSNRFKFKLEQRDCETHHFYVDNVYEMTRWMAVFEQSYHRKSGSQTDAESMLTESTNIRQTEPVRKVRSLPVPEFFNISQENSLMLGLSPRTASYDEKVKIGETYRKKQERIASESHQKMTRLAQRRHSTCQKISRLKRQDSGPAESRRNGLTQQLNEIDEEMHKTLIQSKENLGRIAAEKEKELRSLSSAELTSFEIDSDEDYPSLIALKLKEENRATDDISNQMRRDKKPRSTSRLSGLLEKLPRHLPGSKRSLSRSKSAGPANHEADKLSAPSLTTTARSSLRFNIAEVSSHAAKCREANLSRLKNEPIMDELEKFDEFCSAFTESASVSSGNNGHGARITMAENLI